MKLSQRISFLVASVGVLLAFLAYQSFYGDEHNQAYASFSNNDGVVTYVNYKPAQKRQIRSRLSADIDQLFSLTGHDVVQIFDAPELVRRDLPTTIWQYRNEDCVMDVYFTVDREGDASRANVAHYEVRARDFRQGASEALNAEQCVHDLVDNNVRLSLIDIKSVYKASSK